MTTLADLRGSPAATKEDARELIEKLKHQIQLLEREVRANEELRESKAGANNSTQSSPVVSVQRNVHKGQAPKRDRVEPSVCHEVERLGVVPARLRFWNPVTPDIAVVPSTPLASIATSSTHKLCCNEVVFCAFSSVGFEPAQARPSYWGTMNPLLNTDELASLVHYPVDEEMPRLTKVNYEYDSGDDWDVMESDDGDVIDDGDGDANINVNDEGDSDTDSDTSFVVDDDDNSEGDAEQLSSLVCARDRRQNRLRGKDRLVPGFSGPFENLSSLLHPLSHQTLFAIHTSGLNSALIERTMLHELSLLPGGIPVNASVQSPLVGHDDDQRLSQVKGPLDTIEREKRPRSEKT
ncbi:Hypothetical protein, putative [Bodo saltans]|uniref:Chromatin assembly factor 1 subunit A dimerization domain-containing protein n=1 Tax=Bodo saltans TaxID=75058 RepID=A0A0S4JQR2_BODSA|nr:Hypothetical protein, putative [Bodo saltans]|eukprot:CUG92308.1 Hypothetical protein, putative [Bodo saltans]